MNESEWNDLQRMWRSAPQQAQPVKQELERFRRRRKWLPVDLIVQSLMTLVGLGMGIALIARGGTYFV